MSTETTSGQTSFMEAKLSEVPTPPQPGQMVEGPVVNVLKQKVYVELHPYGTGIIYGREYNAASDPVSRPLFEAFGAAARAWAEGHRPAPARAAV